MMNHANAPGPVSIRPEDAPALAAGKLLEAARQALAQLGEQVVPALLDLAIDRIAPAFRIEFYGDFESSGVIAEAEMRFARAGFAVFASVEAEAQLLAASLLVPEDVVLVVSAGERTLALAEAMARARQSGATLLVMAPAGSVLFAAADLALPLSVDETLMRQSMLPLRIAQFGLLEALAVGVMLRRHAIAGAAGQANHRTTPARRVVVARRGQAEELDLRPAAQTSTDRANG